MEVDGAAPAADASGFSVRVVFRVRVFSEGPVTQSSRTKVRSKTSQSLTRIGIQISSRPNRALIVYHIGTETLLSYNY